MKFRCFVGMLVVLVGMVAAAQPAGGQTEILRPYQLEASATYETTIEYLVPKSEITSRCGDADGCTVRMLGYQGSGISQPAAMVVSFFLSTDALGSKWRTYESGGLVASGDTQDGVPTVAASMAAGADTCTLRDDASTGEFVLSATGKTEFGFVRCALRITD